MRGHYGNHWVGLSGVPKQPHFQGWSQQGANGLDRRDREAFDALQRRALDAAWDSFVKTNAAPSGWLYVASTDLSKEQISIIDPSEACWSIVSKLAGGVLGFWAVITLGASSPMLVHTGIAQNAVRRLASSPLVADQRRREPK